MITIHDWRFVNKRCAACAPIGATFVVGNLLDHPDPKRRGLEAFITLNDPRRPLTTDVKYPGRTLAVSLQGTKVLLGGIAPKYLKWCRTHGVSIADFLRITAGDGR